MENIVFYTHCTTIQHYIIILLLVSLWSLRFLFITVGILFGTYYMVYLISPKLINLANIQQVNKKS